MKSYKSLNNKLELTLKIIMESEKLDPSDFKYSFGKLDIGFFSGFNDGRLVFIKPDGEKLEFNNDESILELIKATGMITERS